MEEAGKGVAGPFEKESDVMIQVPFLERRARTQAQGRLPGNLGPLEDAGVATHAAPAHSPPQLASRLVKPSLRNPDDF